MNHPNSKKQAQKRRIIPFLMIIFLFLVPYPLLAQQSEAHTHDGETPHTHETPKHTHQARPHVHDELRQIRLWLESIEQDTERRRITSEKERKTEEEEIYPLQTSRKTQLSGGLTFITQGITNNEAQFGGNRADGSFSIDIILESEIRANGLLIVRGDFMKGMGLTRHPKLFAGGVNADIEDFSEDPDSLHLIEALYEQTWHEEGYRVSFGQMDPTSYFDQNQFANSETFQFLSPMFVNNIAIAFGGDDNGYGPGLVLHVHPVKMFELNVGFFEGDGNYADIMDQAFLIVEAELENYHGDLEGHYRFIYWSNESNQDTILNPGVMVTNKRGFALSFDEEINETVGFWARFGTQDSETSQFEHSVSFGLQLKGLLGREDAIFGLAYGRTFISHELQKASSLDKDEQVVEAYYNIINRHGFQISPDLQYISHPGGNGAIDPITVYAIRAQLNF